LLSFGELLPLVINLPCFILVFRFSLVADEFSKTFLDPSLVFFILSTFSVEETRPLLPAPFFILIPIHGLLPSFFSKGLDMLSEL
jgi:hypothetical protein